jgi:hypothetical protein
VTELRGDTAWVIRVWDFPFDQWAVTSTQRHVLDAIVAEADQRVIDDSTLMGWTIDQIIGHASPEGEPAYNAELSRKRADAAAADLGRPIGSVLAGGEACAKAASAAEYPYYRAVEIALSFTGSSPMGPFRCGTRTYDPRQFCCVDNRLIAKNPIEDLDECPGRVPNQRMFEFDGCSFPDWMGDWVEGVPEPDAPGGVPFTDPALHGRQPRSVAPVAPCDAHDACYQTCYPADKADEAKLKCDREFWKASMDACRTATSGTDQWHCISTVQKGEKYFFGVLEGGTTRRAFDQRQREYCDCCP